jgi:hypothetical protein
MKKRIIKVLTIMSCLIIVFANLSMADVDFSKADTFISKGAANAGIKDVTEIGEEFSSIGNVLKFIGAGIIVAATAYMGILYMISPPERQAKLKQQLIGLVVSAVVIFGGYYIWKIVGSALNGIMGNK